jgi:hypothetical protein
MLLSDDIIKRDENRMHLMKNEEINAVELLSAVTEFEERLRSQMKGLIQDIASLGALPDYDIDAAAEVLAAVYPEQDPFHILQEQGLIRPNDPFSIDQSALRIDIVEHDDIDELLSPIPDDPTHPPPADDRFQRQRSRWRRILRTALPLQVKPKFFLTLCCEIRPEYCIE